MEDLRDWASSGADAAASGDTRKRRMTRRAPRVMKMPGQSNQDIEGVEKQMRRVKLKAAVPKRSDQPKLLQPTQKNFVVSNAVENILAVRGPRPTEAKRFRDKANFGSVPTYIQSFKNEHAKKQTQRIEEERTEAQKALVDRPEFDMEDDERAQLVHGLKIRWERTNKRYQLMAHHEELDTVGKRSMKETCEAELSEIESSIDKLERGPVRVVTN